MASKTIQESIEKGLCVGPMSSIRNRLIGELRDYFAHQVMFLGEGATAMQLFEKVFSEVPAFNGGKKDEK